MPSALVCERRQELVVTTVFWVCSRRLRCRLDHVGQHANQTWIDVVIWRLDHKTNNNVGGAVQCDQHMWSLPSTHIPPTMSLSSHHLWHSSPCLATFPALSNYSLRSLLMSPEKLWQVRCIVVSHVMIVVIVLKKNNLIDKDDDHRWWQGYFRLYVCSIHNYHCCWRTHRWPGICYWRSLQRRRLPQLHSNSVSEI